MENRHDDTPVINDYTYYVFEQIEARGLQFAIPDQWRPLYRAYLKERKRKREVARAFQRIAVAFELSLSKRTESTRYSESFGYRRTETSEEDSKANTAARPLDE
jgi:hypothetical protein